MSVLKRWRRRVGLAGARLSQGWRLGLQAASIRRRLLLLGVLPVLIAVPLLAMVLVLTSATYDRLLIHKVRADLGTAAQHFERMLEHGGLGVQAVAASGELERQVLPGPDPAPLALPLVPGVLPEPGSRPPPADPLPGPQLGHLLAARRAALGLDSLCLIGTSGRVLHCTGTPATGQAYGAWPVVLSALAGTPRSEVDVAEPEELAAWSAALVHRARVDLQATPNAVADPRQAEPRGLLLHSAAPVWRDGQVVAVLAGAHLLNRNVDFVDQLNAIVYPPGVLMEGSHGTATLFLGDVRVATNVRLPQLGERATGTRVSAAVHEAVLGRGQRWHDRAFVVSDWYVSGYLPLVDSRERRVGMLYVGFLEAPFAAARRGAMGLVAGVFIGTLVVALWLARRLSLSIIRPVERMHQVMSAVEAGQLHSRVQLPRRPDELGALAAHFDRLLERLEDQTRELRERGVTLDAQVAERTRALQAALTELHTAQHQMVRQEQLAAVGQLTAGVAHEINNPVAVIQGNLDLLRERLGEHAQPVRHELGLIREQVQRIRLIVAKLLQFSRPSEYAGHVDVIQPAAVVQDCLLLVGHLLRRSRIAVEHRSEATRSIAASRSELQQVLVNLLVNAIQAMPEQGLLQLREFDLPGPDGQPGVAFEIADSGPGIAPELMDKLFQPFFTTKQHGAGTGLGLWVSRTLVERFGGEIRVLSKPGRGAVFTVWMP